MISGDGQALLFHEGLRFGEGLSIEKVTFNLDLSLPYKFLCKDA